VSSAEREEREAIDERNDLRERPGFRGMTSGAFRTRATAAVAAP